MTYSRISGTGSYLPEKILTNSELERMVDTSDEWIRTRTGIVERHIAADNEMASDLALNASRNALAGKHFQYKARSGDQSPGVTRADARLGLAAFHQIDRHSHRGIFFPAQGEGGRLVHTDNLARRP